ncbi:hypothetical protein AOQ84DRAFT_284670 [Glonium stellatum]|uniref:Uncharacterized protein n=1 Tax=Glonium stellatum TaxID=574774 RepID=A0A8E2F9D2_9PEZI|nr:hypothetical protein AOQ84DRAFT_284670 [Glonium stellatum]
MESDCKYNASPGGEALEPQPGDQQAFLFINSSNGVRGSIKPNRAVRSFIMHQARKQRQWSTRKVPGSKGMRRGTKYFPNHEGLEDAESLPWFHYSPKEEDTRRINNLLKPRRSVNGRQSSESSTVCSCEDESCSHKQPDSVATSPASSLDRDFFAIGVLDPFDSLPIQTDSKTSALIDHFAGIVSPRIIPLDTRHQSKVATTEWLAKALQDSSRSAFAQAVLCSAALHLYVTGTGTMDYVLYHKTRAISEINSNLCDPESSIDDNNIAAVFTLLTIEETMLVPDAGHGHGPAGLTQRMIHLNGLRAMIEQRGGLSALATNKCLQSFILWHSIAHSVASFQRPYAALIDSHGLPYKYDISSFRARPSSTQMIRLCKDVKADADLLEIIVDVIAYSSDVTFWFDDPRCPLDPLELQKHASLLHYRLFDWYDRSAEVRNTLDQCICLSLLIFAVRISQPADQTYRSIMVTTVQRLREALKKTNIFKWAKAPDLLLWTLTIGTLAAQGSPEMGFFAQYCSVAFADAGFGEDTKCEELLRRMRKLLWICSLLDKDVERLWARIGVAKASDEGVPEAEDDLEEPLKSPDIKDAAVGLLTSKRFFT